MNNKSDLRPTDLLSEDGPVLIVAAHPDDEVIGLGGHLRFLKKPVIVHTTDGAPRALPNRQNYGLLRRAELERAVALAGISSDRLRTFGAVDQESIAVVQELCAFLMRLIVEIRPDVVVTHPYEGGHPDHDTAAFSVALALKRLGAQDAPIIEFASYHNGNPMGLATMRAGEFLQNSSEIETVTLSVESCARKAEMLRCFESQQDMLINFPVGVERFRYAPSYDFTRPPHDGRLFYEEQNWGVSGKEWCRLARQALHAPHKQL
jgi:LmbE family N-acetylglucosaminyl deacetylase